MVVVDVGEPNRHDRAGGRIRSDRDVKQNVDVGMPWAESGKETISAESPVKLSEALQAVRSGKLPRKAGMSFGS